MLKKLFILFAVLSLVGCKYSLDDEKPPKDLIETEAFTKILHDIMVVEAYYKVKYSSDREYLEHLPAVIDSVFQKHGVDSLRFSNSMDYYANEQIELIHMYMKIQDDLMLNAVELENE